MAIIYTDQLNSGNVLMNNTPAAVYAGLSCFATILDNIASGEIPSGSGEPFPVNWEESPDDGLPWYSNTNGPKSTIPWKNY